MKHNDLLVKYDIDEARLEQFGFLRGEYHCDLENGFEAVIRINKDNWESEVFDKDTGDMYMPYNVTTFQGDLIAELRDKVDKINHMIGEQCQKQGSKLTFIKAYVKEKYGVEITYPFSEPGEGGVFRRDDSDKWFGVVMKVKLKAFGFDSLERVDVMNIKVPTEQIEGLIDNKAFWPCYHMNKKYWISIMTEQITDMEQVFRLIDQSYELVGKKKKGSRGS